MHLIWMPSRWVHHHRVLDTSQSGVPREQHLNTRWVSGPTVLPTPDHQRQARSGLACTASATASASNFASRLTRHHLAGVWASVGNQIVRKGEQLANVLGQLLHKAASGLELRDQLQRRQASASANLLEGATSCSLRQSWMLDLQGKWDLCD